MNTGERQVFLDRRRAGIGGSDIAALLGLSPYKTRYELWLDKTGRSTDSFDEAQIERMRWGNVLEDVVAKYYAEKTSEHIHRVNAQMSIPNTIAIANIDRAISKGKGYARWNGKELVGAKKILEVKTVSAYAENGGDWGDEGTDEVPITYFLQCRWYMGITRVHSCDVAALFGGQKLKIYNIQHDQSFFEEMVNEAVYFWDRYVIPDIPPPACNANDARAQWVKHEPLKTAVADGEVVKAIDDYKIIKAKIKSLESDVQDCLNVILPAIGNAESLIYENKVIATWKANKDSISTDWEKAFLSLVDIAGIKNASEIIANNQTTKTGARVLRIKESK